MLFLFFHDTSTTEIYTLSLHDALPILRAPSASLMSTPLRGVPPSSISGGVAAGPKRGWLARNRYVPAGRPAIDQADRKSTRLNSSHGYISYAVFCLKKKNTTEICCSAT